MSNQCITIWESMVLFNQVTLRNILEGQDDLSTPEVCKPVAKLNVEQKADTLLFLNNNIEELAVLLAGWGSLAIKLVKQLLDEMPIFDPNEGAVSITRDIHSPAMEIASSLLPKFEDFFRACKGRLQVH